MPPTEHKPGNKIIYIGKGDITWWDRAAQLAEERDTSLSKLIAGLLRREVMAEQLTQAAGDEPTTEDLIDEVEEKLRTIRRRVS